jgi:predicted membrane-bound spermidine synthase
MKNKAFSFYTGVFLISSLVMALQILQSRLFSVTSWYHLSFLVISMAMFGLTLGALKIYRGDEEYQRRNYGLIARKYSMGFGFFSIIALITQLYIPIISSNALKTMLTLPVNAFTSGMAYYFAGVVITVCLTRAPFPIGKTYGADLIGAGIGCLAALILMETIDTPSAILILSGIAFLSAMAFPVEDDAPNDIRIGVKRYNLKKLALIFITGSLSVGALNSALPTPLFYPLWSKGVFIKMSEIDYEGWNSISRVTVMNEEMREPFMWGPSPVSPIVTKFPSKFLIIDGDAGTPITKFDGDFTKHGYLEYDVTNIAYNLPNLKTAAIIGVGGGRDLLSAKYFGVEKVTALDVNPVQIHLLRDHTKYREYANLYKLSGVKILNEEARSWFRQNTEKLDIVQMSLIDTWAATGAGAFALSENGLYTTEAWDIFMNDLSDNGVFTLSRWSASAQDDSGRALSVAMATLFNQGVKDVQQHIALFNSMNIATLVVSKSPFTTEQISALEEAALEKQFIIMLLPGREPAGGLIAELINAQSIKEIEEISDKYFFDYTPSTDMRPFFFNQAPLTKPWKVAELVLKGSDGVHQVGLGQAKATFNLYLIIIFSVLMVAFVIIRPLLKTVENKTSPFILAGTLYFMLIGLGFMFMEISLLQALGVFLGHPIYGLSVVLFSLIMSAGIGSFLSEKIPLKSLPRQIIWCLLVFAYGIAMSKLLPEMFHDYAEVDIFTRVLISIAVMAPAGLLMGFGFPTGLRLTERFDARATAWFWGINGATGVLGSSLALAFNIVMGIDNTLIIAGACYALLAVPFIVFHIIGNNKNLTLS